LEAGQLRGDRLELAADLGRGVRLQVDRVHLRRAAVEVDIDDRLCRGADAGRGLGAEQVGERQAGETQGAGAKGSPEDGEHGSVSRQGRKRLPGDEYEFLQRMTRRIDKPAVATGGQDDLADVQVAVRIEAQVMRGEEVPRRTWIARPAPA